MLRTWLTRGAIALIVTAWGAVSVREITNASRFQLFGDYVARVDTSEKVVAITFDDGPHPVHTPRVLEVLDRHGAKATFFLMGRNVERYPDVARDVLRRGHEIGNHSYSHPRLVFMWPSTVREEIERTDALLRGIGVSGAIRFRPPHTAKFIVVPYVLRQMDKLSVLIEVDAEEWTNPPAAEITKTILGGVKPGAIVGMHDTNGEETIRALDETLTALVAQGYTFETVSQLVTRRH